MRKKNLITTGLTVLILAMVSVSGFSAPPLMNFQGKVTDSSGSLVEGSINMTFSLYTVQVGGQPVWQEQQNVEGKMVWQG